jgi:hypothetical protein
MPKFKPTLPLSILKPKKLDSGINITLRLEKLNGKCLLEKDSDMVMRNLVRVLYHILANYETVTGPSITLTAVTGGSYSGAIQQSTAKNYIRDFFMYGSTPMGDIGADGNGIVIGIGTTPPTRTDYALVNKIAHGSGSGQISYQRQTYAHPNDYQFTLTREFTNAGSDLAVAEAGYYQVIWIAGSSTTYMLLRDTFTAVNVTTGNGIRVRYTFSF